MREKHHKKKDYNPRIQFCTVEREEVVWLDSRFDFHIRLFQGRKLISQVVDMTQTAKLQLQSANNYRLILHGGKKLCETNAFK